MRAPPGLVVCLLAAVLLAACGGKWSEPASTRILDGQAQNASFPEVRQAIDRLYRDHPGVESLRP